MNIIVQYLKKDVRQFSRTEDIFGKVPHACSYFYKHIGNANRTLYTQNLFVT